MRFLTIVLGIFFLAFACQDKTTSPLRKRKAHKILIGSRKTDSVTWRLVKMYEPYYKGFTYYYKDSTDFHYLTLRHNGTFDESDRENNSQGFWYLNKEKKKLAFVYTNRNGIEISESLQQLFFRHAIDSVYLDTVVLSVQGRHGMVKYFYLNPFGENISFDSLSIKTDSISPPPLDSLAKDSLDNSVKN